METTPYIITFTPESRFFFGGNYSFSESFYAESLKLPQPTTILGCIRNTLLIQEGLVLKDKPGFPDIESDRNRAKELTGTAKIERLDDTDTNFGVIDKVSPVFLVKRDESYKFLFKVPKDVIKNTKSGNLEIFGYNRIDGAKSSYSGNNVNYAILTEKEHKAINAEYYGDEEFWKAYKNGGTIQYNQDFEEDQIFSRYVGVGIKKFGGKEAYYTKIEYSLKKGYSFAVVVWFKGNKILNDDIVVLGGEQSTFKMEVIEAKKIVKNGQHPVLDCILNGECHLLDNLKNCSGTCKMIALSPIVLDANQSITFAKAVEHRIVIGVESTRFVKRLGFSGKSEATRMIPSGSVFYVKDNALISEWELPYKIGYNYIFTIRR